VNLTLRAVFRCHEFFGNDVLHFPSYLSLISSWARYNSSFCGEADLIRVLDPIATAVGTEARAEDRDVVVTACCIEHGQILHYVARDVVSEIEDVQSIRKLMRFLSTKLRIVQNPSVNDLLAFFDELLEHFRELMDFSANSLDFFGLDLLMEILGISLAFSFTQILIRLVV